MCCTLHILLFYGFNQIFDYSSTIPILPFFALFNEQQNGSLWQRDGSDETNEQVTNADLLGTRLKLFLHVYLNTGCIWNMYLGLKRESTWKKWANYNHKMHQNSPLGFIFFVNFLVCVCGWGVGDHLSSKRAAFGILCYIFPFCLHWPLSSLLTIKILTLNFVVQLLLVLLIVNVIFCVHARVCQDSSLYLTSSQLISNCSIGYSLNI